MTGHAARRYRFPKRTFRNQYLGPFINHEMNRCITVLPLRALLQGLRRRPRPRRVRRRTTTSTSAATRTACSRTSSRGNLVEVCPTGVFTDKTLKQHYTRKWDLAVAPSVCVALRRRLQHDRRRALRRAAAHPQPLPRRSERLLPVRPRPLRLRVREPPRAPAPAAAARRAPASSPTPRRSPRSSASPSCSARASSYRHRLAARQSRVELRAASAGRRQRVLPRPGRGRGRAARAAGWRSSPPVPPRAPRSRTCGEADAVLVLGEDLTDTAPRAGARAAAGRDGGADRRTCRVTFRAGTTRRCASRVRHQARAVLHRRRRCRRDSTTWRRARCVSTPAAPPSSRWRWRARWVKATVGRARARASPTPASWSAEIAAALRAAKRPLVVAGTASGDRGLLDAAAAVRERLRRARPHRADRLRSATASASR